MVFWQRCSQLVYILYWAINFRLNLLNQSTNFDLPSSSFIQSLSTEGFEAVKHAVDAGYRQFDTAALYLNEEEVGRALREKIEEGVVKREDLYVVTKLWNTFHRPEDVEPTCRKSNETLGLGYIDLYLMHWPMAFEEVASNYNGILDNGEAANM